MKIIKRTLLVLGCLVGLVVLALLAHPLWVGCVVKTAVKTVTPRVAGVPANLEACDINLWTGKVALKGFDLSNPAGCASASAARVGTLSVSFDTLSVFKDAILIHDITIDDVFVSYEKGASGKMNMTELSDNAAGATSSDDTIEEEVSEEVAEAREEEAAGDADEDGTKIIIEKVSVSGVTVSMMGVPMPIPGTITLTDIGKESGGVSPMGACLEIAAQLQKSLGSVGEGLTALGKGGLDLGKSGLDLGASGLTNSVEAVKNLDFEGAKDILDTTGEGLKGVGKDFESLGKGVRDLFKKK